MKKSIWRRLWNIFTTLLVIVVVALAFLIIGVRLFGLKTFVVLSPSMEPTFSTGSVVYVKSIAPEDVKVDDVITFYLDDETSATHRVVEVLTDANGQPCFRTKGDANRIPDTRVVTADQLIGKEIVAIPKLGKLVEYIHTPNGRLVAIGAGVLLVILIAIPDLFFSKHPDKESKAEDRTETIELGTAQKDDEDGKTDNDTDI